MGRAEIVLGRKMSDGPNLIVIFLENYDMGIGLHSVGPKILMG